MANLELLGLRTLIFDVRIGVVFLEQANSLRITNFNLVGDVETSG